VRRRKLSLNLWGRFSPERRKGLGQIQGEEFWDPKNAESFAKKKKKKGKNSLAF